MHTQEALVLISKLRSADLLDRIMRAQDFSYRTLADEATRRGRKFKPQVNVSPATIGHLITGHQSWVNPERGRAIELALGQPAGTLFVQQVSRVARGNGHRERATA
jgi:hypothetical protein